MKSSQKKTSGQQSALEVRLNRALEEIEKYKGALQKARSDQKVTLHHDVVFSPGSIMFQTLFTYM